MILTSQEICSNYMIGKDAPMLTRKEVELNSMMVSSFTLPDMMQRIVGDGGRVFVQEGGSTISPPYSTLAPLLF